MIRQCPQCRSHNVRRSLLHVSDITWRHVFLSPYRCRECRARFWVLSRNAYFSAVAIAATFLTAAVVWNASHMPVEHRDTSAPKEAGTKTPRFEETVALAEKNDPEAQYALSRLYAQGIDVRKDEKSARMWLERAAQLGSSEAQLELGLQLRDGRGVIQDFERAAKWLHQAAVRGNANAQYELGRMYLAGMGLVADNVKAYLWFNLAAASGVEGAIIARDAALRSLGPAQVAEAQAEARKLTEQWSSPVAPPK